MSIKTYAMAVRDTIAAEMRRDEKVFIMGEDIESIGSIFGCTRDLTAEFGRERGRRCFQRRWTAKPVRRCRSRCFRR